MQISDDVMRKKCEYQKHLEYYKLLRSKFEEHYIKGIYIYNIKNYKFRAVLSSHSNKLDLFQTNH